MCIRDSPNAYAQAVAKGTAPNIVLLVPVISDPYFASVSQGVVKAAAERGISVTIGVAATPHEELEAVRKSVSTRPRGIIISESEYTDAPERQALQTELTQYEASGGRAVFVLNRNPVSYTHLDVYKRQRFDRARATMLGS